MHESYSRVVLDLDSNHQILHYYVAYKWVMSRIIESRLSTQSFQQSYLIISYEVIKATSIHPS